MGLLDGLKALIGKGGTDEDKAGSGEWRPAVEAGPAQMSASGYDVAPMTTAEREEQSEKLPSERRPPPLPAPRPRSPLPPFSYHRFDTPRGPQA